MKHELLIVDFGSQYTQLIARNLRQQGYYTTIVSQNSLDGSKSFDVAGIILAGSPRSAAQEKDEHINTFIQTCQVPILGICYGMHLLAKFYGGKIVRGNQGEYGAATVKLLGESALFQGVEKNLAVWMSHGDEIHQLPEGFRATAQSESGILSAYESEDKQIYAVQFHPEVSHTNQGDKILANFAQICGCKALWTKNNILNQILEDMRRQVGEKGRGIIALSGGVDSTVACVLAHRVFNDRMRPILVDGGLLREGEVEWVLSQIRERLGIDVHCIDAQDIFLNALKGVTDPEKKRSIIGEMFIRVFEKEIKKYEQADWLLQGTIYPDVIESAGIEGAKVIKSHHNVGGLPKDMKLRLLEPLRMLFKDEVRNLGRTLGIDDSLLMRHPFPGPGLAVRIVGEVTRERLKILRRADAIYLEELHNADYYHKVSQAFCVFLPLKSVGVGGDERSYGYVIALRAVITNDFMTAHAAALSPALLQRISARIINEIPEVGRVVYDCSSKPPATIEWE